VNQGFMQYVNTKRETKGVLTSSAFAVSLYVGSIAIHDVELAKPRRPLQLQCSCKTGSLSTNRAQQRRSGGAPVASFAIAELGFRQPHHSSCSFGGATSLLEQVDRGNHSRPGIARPNSELCLTVLRVTHMRVTALPDFLGPKSLVEPQLFCPHLEPHPFIRHPSSRRTIPTTPYRVLLSGCCLIDKVSV
jgi:hypothetical protein